MHPEPGFEGELASFNLFAYLSRSPGDLEPVGRVGLRRQPVLPDDRGVHPADHPRQRPRRVVHPAVGRDLSGTSRTGTPAPRGRRSSMRPGDVAAMPADIRHQGYAPKRSMLLVWENADPELPGAHLERPAAVDAGRALSARPAVTVGRVVTTRPSRPRPDRLFIGGEFVDARRRRDVRDARSARRIGARRRSPEAGRRTSIVAVAAAAAAFPAWARIAGGRPRPPAAPARRPDRGDADELAAPRVARHRPSDPRQPQPRRRPDRRDVPLLRRHGRQDPGRRHPGRARLPELRPARAARRRRA